MYSVKTNENYISLNLLYNSRLARSTCEREERTEKLELLSVMSVAKDEEQLSMFAWIREVWCGV